MSVSSVSAQPHNIAEEIRNAGESITSCLRHVPKKQKSYEQNLSHGPVDMSSLETKKKEAEIRKLESGKVVDQKLADGISTETKEPILRLESDKRWVIKSHTGKRDDQITLQVDNVQIHHTVFIQNCRYIYVKIIGKINSVCIMDCDNLQLELASVVSSTEILGSTNIDVQVAEAASSIVIEDSSLVNLYLLNRECSLQTEFFSSRISTVNVLFPSNEDPEDMIECALPDQFVSRILQDTEKGDMIETKPNRH